MIVMPMKLSRMFSATDQVQDGLVARNDVAHVTKLSEAKVPSIVHFIWVDVRHHLLATAKREPICCSNDQFLITCAPRCL